MNPTELVNAVTTLCPSVVVSYFYMYNQSLCNTYTLSISIGTLLHMPFSFTYHVLCAFDYFTHRVDCVGRKLDQTFIHVTCVFFSYGLSASPLYAGCNVLVNTLCIRRIWIQGAHDTPFNRRRNVAAASILYMAPLLWRGDYATFFTAYVGFLGIGSLAFMCQMYAGHAIFHILLGPFVYQLLYSAMNISYSRIEGSEVVRGLSSL